VGIRFVAVAGLPDVVDRDLVGRETPLSTHWRDQNILNTLLRRMVDDWSLSDTVKSFQCTVRVTLSPDVSTEKGKIAWEEMHTRFSCMTVYMYDLAQKEMRTLFTRTEFAKGFVLGAASRWSFDDEKAALLL
jgi:hypothetical protein